jgi:hypothetical protein
MKELKGFWKVAGLLLVILSGVSALSFAEENEIKETKKIQDNSFLIEEAYNQEPGVIQHIQTFQYMKDGTWGYTFTQEWPIKGQTHQFSYTIPVSHLTDPGRTGMGDVALNYRYQLINKERIAIAPRFSLLLPTGRVKKDFGRGTLGYQTNIPLSLELSDKWVTHWNLGATFTPHRKGPDGGKANTFDLNAGASIIYLLSENLNLMLEAVWNSNQSVEADGKRKRDHTFFINPGIRYAIDFKSGLQIVPGVGFPIGVGPSRNEYGVFLYLSFEHPLFKQKELSAQEKKENNGMESQ